MCSGALLPKIVAFALPLMLTTMLQLLFNAADIMVVGRYTGPHALAAVGATSALIHLLVNLFAGIALAANVLVARYCGAKEPAQVHETVHTAMCMAGIGGVLMIFVGVLAARPVLAAMATPDDVIEQATLYMRVYFTGMPFLVVYNFGAAILRAVGDTRRPLYFLTLAGVVNVLFNLLFVIVFKLGVVGVAIATVISQAISAVLVLQCLCRSESVIRLCPRALCIHRDKLIAILRIGIPAALQGVLISLSNVLIQSSVNSFGSLAIAGNTAATNIDGFLYAAVNAISQTVVSFTSQNMGARLYRRVDQTLIQGLLLVCAIGTSLGVGSYVFGYQLLHLYSPDPQVAAYGILRLGIIGIPYALGGAMDVLPSSLRGMGCSLLPTAISLTGVCLFRVLWIMTVFQTHRTLVALYISYPVSWLITVVMQLICYLVMRRRMFAAAGAPEDGLAG